MNVQKLNYTPPPSSAAEAVAFQQRAKGFVGCDVYLLRLLDPYNCNDSAAGGQYIYYLGQERSQVIGESVILFVHFLLFLFTLTINSPPFTVFSGPAVSYTV